MKSTKAYKEIVLNIYLKDPIKVARDHGGGPGRALAFLVGCCGGRRTGQRLVISQISDTLRAQMKRLVKERGIERYTTVRVTSRDCKHVDIMIRLSDLNATMKILMGRLRGTIASAVLSNNQILRKLADEMQSVSKAALMNRGIEGNVSCAIGNGNFCAAALGESSGV